MKPSVSAPPEDAGDLRTRPFGANRGLVVLSVVVLVAAMAVHLVMSRDELAQLGRLSSRVLLAVLAVQLLSQVAWNGAMLLPLRLHMRELGFWELFMVRTGGLLAGGLVPIAGSLGVRLAYLRRRGLAYAHFTWATLVTNALGLLSIGAVAVIALGVLWQVAGPLPPVVVGLTGGVLILGIAAVALLYFLPRLASHRWLVRRPSWVELGQLRATGRVFGWVLAFALVRHLLNFLTYGLLYQSLSSTQGLLTGGLVYALTSPVRVVQIVPGNIGLSEWTVALVGGMLSYDVTTGLLVAMVARGMTLLAQGLGTLAGGAWLSFRSGS